MYVVFRNAGDYGSRYSSPTVFFLTRKQADKAARNATDFIKRAGLLGRDASKLPDDVQYGDDAGSDAPWDAHVAQHGGLPAGDPNLTTGSFDFYGIHPYTVRQIAVGKVSG